MKSILVYILFIFFIVLMLLKIVFFYIKERVLTECIYRRYHLHTVMANDRGEQASLTENRLSAIDTFVNISEASVQVKLNVNNHELNTINNVRSRYAMFVACDSTSTLSSKIHRHAHRDREPSRISFKSLTSIFRKSRKLRKYIRRIIKKQVLASSNIHIFLKNIRIIALNVYSYSDVKCKVHYRSRRHSFSKTTYGSPQQMRIVKGLKRHIKVKCNAIISQYI